MSQEITPSPNNGTLISTDLKKLLLVPILSLVGAFGISYVTTQRSQDRLSYQVDTLKENKAENEIRDAKRDELMNQMTISIARISETITRITQDQRDAEAERRNASQRSR